MWVKVLLDGFITPAFALYLSDNAVSDVTYA